MKKPIYSNRPIDFNTLNHREFEEVVYHYFKSQINKGLYKGTYDNIELSSGVGEKGADLLLFYNGVIKGIIQCKKYKDNIGVDTIFSEILKFLIYHVQYAKKTNGVSSTLIQNIEDFTYYLVASKDFTQATKIFLADFQNNWKSKDVKALITKELNKKVAFKNLKVEDILSDIESLLNQFNIISLNAVDLDPVVRSNTDIINRYFLPIRFTDDNQIIEKLEEVIESKNFLDENELYSKASRLSKDITRVKPHFGKDESLKIPRSEVKEIMDWVSKELKENEANIAVVSGNAGMGKSVIISEVYNELIESNIPVICLKADKQIFDSIIELESELEVDITFTDFFNQLIKDNNYGVLLIDQIDALSQALSSNLKPLKFYDNLIQRFIGKPNIKIILSTRVYDLNYDPIIANYKGKKKFRVKKLDKSILIDILNKSKVKRVNQFSDSFLDLLSVPLHLEVFLKVYSKNLNIDEIKSLQDLYDELWRQKITSNEHKPVAKINFNKVVKLIYRLADRMYIKQQIHIPSIYFEDTFASELRYLKSEGIIEGGDNIGFFHQSFFDYSFARDFVSNEKSLVDNITSQHQGLFIRSKVKQILNYTRSVDIDQYISDVIAILENNTIRFHIKLLVLQLIAFQEEPSVSEKKVVKDIVLTHKTFNDAFLSLYLGKGWFNFFIDNDLFRIDIETNNDNSKEQILGVLNRFIFSDGNALLKYYRSLKESKIKDELVIDYLWRVNKIQNKLAIDLIEDVFDKNPNYINEYWFYRILEGSVANFPEWTKKQLLKTINIKTGTNINDRGDYFVSVSKTNEVYKKFWELHPKMTYDLVKTIISEIIRKRSYDPRKNLILDEAFWLYDRKNNDLYTHHQKLDELQSYLIKNFSNKQDFIRDEVNNYISSNYVTEIVIGFSVIKEYPESFLNEAYSFFSNLDKFSEAHGLSQYLNYLLLDVFGKTYHLFSDKERSYLNKNVISKFYKDYEKRLIERNGKKIKNKFYGIVKYELLSAVEKHGGVKDQKLLKEYQEGKRKFGIIENKEPEGVTVHVNRDPINGNYDKFSDQDWINSFRKYTINNKNFDNWNFPSEFEHGRRFSSTISQDPKKYVELISKIIEDNTISITYVIKGLEGLKEGGVDSNILLELFTRTINREDIDNENMLYLIWLTRYFTEQKIVYPQVLQFLRRNLINGNEGREGVEGDLTTGINSVRGAAASALAGYAFSDETFDFICESLELLVENSKPSTRAAAIHKMQYLIRHDRDRVLKLFLDLSKDYNPNVLKVAIMPLQYLVHHDFAALNEFFQKALLQKKADNEIGTLLTIAFCNDYKGSKELLHSFLEVNKPNSCVKTAFEFIEHENKIENALKILNKFLGREEEELGDLYNSSFFHIKPNVFPHIYTFLEQYVVSKIGKYRAHAFYAYLHKCTNEYPKECIKLAKEFHTKSKSDITRYLENEPINVIISAYNAIREYKKTDDSLENAVDVFDEILQNKNYGVSAAQRILKDLDSY